MATTDSFSARAPLAVASAVLFAAPSAALTRLAERAALDAALLPGAPADDYEGVDLHGLTFWILADVGETVGAAQVPELLPGVLYTSSQSVLEVQDIGLQGGGRTQVLAAGIAQPNVLTLDFEDPVTAFGFDFFISLATGTDVTVDVFAPDDATPLGTRVFEIFLDSQFVGLFDSGGIGRAEVRAFAPGPSVDSYRVRIDGLAFGVPEPGTASLVAAGLVALAGEARRHTPGRIGTHG